MQSDQVTRTPDGIRPLDEEAAAVEVGHRAVAELGAEDEAGQVVAGRLGAAPGGELDGVHRHLDAGLGVALGLAAVPVGVDVGVLAAGASLRELMDHRPVVFRQAHQLADHS